MMSLKNDELNSVQKNLNSTIDELSDDYDNSGNIQKTGLYKLFCECIDYALPNNTSATKLLYIIIFLFSILGAYMLIVEDNSIDNFNSIMNVILDIYIALFSASLIGFSLIQSLKGTSVCEMLQVSNDENKTSIYLEYCHALLGIIMFYMLMIICLFAINILIVPNLELLSKIPVIISITMLSCFFTITFHGLIETFSFIYNLYSIYTFNTYIDISNDIDDEETDSM